MTWALLQTMALATVWSADRNAVELPVPIVRQAPDRCGPAALAMVLRFYGADSAAVAGAESAYDPVLRGALITDLAACARRVGFAARVATLAPESLEVLLRSGIPPVVLFQRGVGPVGRGHYGVIVGWNPRRGDYALNDGGRSTHTMDRRQLVRRWKAAGFQALIVTAPSP